MTDYLLVDGENFVHGIVHVLRSKGAIKSRDTLHRLDFKTLAKEIGGCEVRYYTTRIQEPKRSSSLFPVVEKMRYWNSFWVPYLANQGIKIVKAGILKVRDSKRCANCRHKTEVLVEKGVDVRLGVDIVSLASSGVTIYIFSSDSDLIPAILNARNQGAKVIYVAVQGVVNCAMQKSCDRTVIIRREAILKAYNKANV